MEIILLLHRFAIIIHKSYISSQTIVKKIKIFFCVSKIKPRDIIEISFKFLIISGKIVVDDK